MSLQADRSSTSTQNRIDSTLQNHKLINKKNLSPYHLFYTFVPYLQPVCIMNNILTHTKQFPFHAAITTGVYAVGFDVFIFVRPRRGC